VIKVPPVRSRFLIADKRAGAGVTIEKGDVVFAVECRQNFEEIALMHLDALLHPGRGDVLPRQRDMLGIALDCVDLRLRRAMRERQRRVTERTAAFENTARIGHGRDGAEQWTIVVRPSAAPMLGAMLERRLANVRKRIGRSALLAQARLG